MLRFNTFKAGLLKTYLDRSVFRSVPSKIISKIVGVAKMHVNLIVIIGCDENPDSSMVIRFTGSTGITIRHTPYNNEHFREDNRYHDAESTSNCSLQKWWFAPASRLG